MIESNTEKFFKWLDEMERMNGLSDRKVAKRGKFSPSMLSTCRKQMRMPTSDLCLKIATGLHADPIDTLRKASYLPIPPNYDSEYEFTRAWFDELIPEQKIVIRTLILTLLELNKKK